MARADSWKHVRTALKQYRDGLGLKDADVARALGVTQSAVTQFLRGRTRTAGVEPQMSGPSVRLLYAVSVLLRQPMESLLPREITRTVTINASVSDNPSQWNADTLKILSNFVRRDGARIAEALGHAHPAARPLDADFVDALEDTFRVELGRLALGVVVQLLDLPPEGTSTALDPPVKRSGPARHAQGRSGTTDR